MKRLRFIMERYEKYKDSGVEWIDGYKTKIGYEINFRNMRSFCLIFPNRNALRTELSWTHYRSLVRIFDQHQKGQGDNPTIGLILCSEKNEAVAKYSVLTDSQQLFASKYLPFLPSEEELRNELERERKLLVEGE